MAAGGAAICDRLETGPLEAPFDYFVQDRQLAHRCALGMIEESTL